MLCYLIITLLGGMGLIRLWRERERVHFFFFLLSVIPLLVLTYGGSFWSFTANLQPLRFSCSYQVYISLPAIIGLFWLVEKAKIISLPWRIGIVFALLAVMGAVVGEKFVHNVFNKQPFNTILSDQGRNLLNYLQEKTDPPRKIEPVMLMDDPVGFIRCRSTEKVNCL